MGSNCSERLAGTYLAPRPWLTMQCWPTIERMARVGLTALAAPPDFLALDTVAAVVQERYTQVLWIRLQTADADPGALLVTLLGAAARLDAEASQGITEDVAGYARHGEWQDGYQLLADWLVAATVPPAVLVLEGAEHIEAGDPASLDMLMSALLPHLRGNFDVLLIGFREWDPRRLDPHGQVLGRSRLQLDRCAVARLAEAFIPGFPTAILDRSLAITRGAAGALQAAFLTGAVLGPQVFCRTTERAGNAQDLLSALGRHLLERSDRHALVCLAGASRLGVWHPAMARALGVSTLHRNEPWWLDLAEGWQQLNPAWRAPLRSAGATRNIDPASLTLLADYVSSQGAGDRAIDLYMEAKEISRAADTAVNVACDLASTGSWMTLARLGQTLARDYPVAGGIPESRQIGKHVAPWWGGRLIRRARRSPGWTGLAPTRLPVLIAEARDARPPPALTPSLALPDARWPEPLPRPAVARTAARKVTPDMTVHLFGELRVTFQDRPVEIWSSGRGRVVFEYLLVNRHSKVRRDRLMRIFWPEVSPDAARNSLNVAIHGLRQSLRTVVGDTAVVIHQDQAYFIEPTLDIWVDAEVFEEQLKAAHQHLASGELASAEADFEAATWLYQGEFLADAYEEWAVVTREHLRLCYLDALDRLGALRLNSGDYVGCVTVCLKLLACDSCREDAHCRLMRCYSRQGQVQLAIRQYHSCAAALRRELEVDPAAATTELFDRLRRREYI